MFSFMQAIQSNSFTLAFLSSVRTQKTFFKSFLLKKIEQVALLALRPLKVIGVLISQPYSMVRVAMEAKSLKDPSLINNISILKDTSISSGKVLGNIIGLVHDILGIFGINFNSSISRKIPVGDRPFYSGRAGFPNPENNRCGLNSMCVIYAHAFDLDGAFDHLDQKQQERAWKIIGILRGEKLGSLKEGDSDFLYEALQQLDEDKRNFFTGRLGTSKKDLRTQLQKQLYSENWRAIRFGGRGHWQAFVRNPDGITVDVINDNWHRYTINIDSILNHWSNPRAWNKSQLTFY